MNGNNCKITQKYVLYLNYEPILQNNIINTVISIEAVQSNYILFL